MQLEIYYYSLSGHRVVKSTERCRGASFPEEHSGVGGEAPKRYYGKNSSTLDDTECQNRRYWKLDV